MTQPATQPVPYPVPQPARPRVRTIQPLLREVYGRLLRRLRQRQGRTLAEVAAEAGISMAYLSEVERGLKEPSSEILAAVCGALDATIVGLVGAAHQELRDLIEQAAPETRVLDLTSPLGDHALSGSPPSTGATLSLVA